MIPDNLKKLEQEGWKATEDKNYLQAEELYKNCIKEYQVHIGESRLSAYWHGAGYALLRQYKYEEAFECFMVSCKLSEKNPKPLFNLGLTSYYLGYDKLSIKYFDLALKFDTSNFLLNDIYYFKSKSLMRLNRLIESKYLLDFLISNNPKKRILFQRGKIFYFIQNYTYALIDFKSAKELGFSSENGDNMEEITNFINLSVDELKKLENKNKNILDELNRRKEFY